MNLHAEKISLSDMVYQIADEMNIHHAIDAMDVPHGNIENEHVPEKGPSHQYYASASLDAHREKAHIHTILERKNRSCLTHIDPGLSEECPITMICLWDHLYQDDPKCLAEFNEYVKLSQQYSIQLRIVIILLHPDLDLTNQIPENTLCLPGFDRVSRELAIFKIVQEES
jgi:hypothetical protein